MPFTEMGKTCVGEASLGVENQQLFSDMLIGWLLGNQWRHGSDMEMGLCRNMCRRGVPPYPPELHSQTPREC